MRTKKILLILLTFTVMALPVFPAAAGVLPYWAQQWKDWAQSTGNSDHIEWAEQYCSPESIRLGTAWEAYLGYNAVDIVAKDKTSPSIKPGLVITPDNVKQYEKELRALFPYGFDWEVDRMMGTGAFADYNYFPLEMEIVPTHHQWNDEGYMQAAKKYSSTCKIGPSDELVGWTAGLPFPKPENALQMVHNYDRLTIMGDNLNSMPMHFGLYGKNGSVTSFL